MIFIAAQTPIEKITNTKEELELEPFFLFSSNIHSKDYRKDNELNKMYYILHRYKFYSREKLYIYLMTKNYYLKTNICKTLSPICEWLIFDKNIDLGIQTEKDKEIMKLNREKGYIYTNDILRNGLIQFKSNNFDQNPICEIVLGE